MSAATDLSKFRVSGGIFNFQATETSDHEGYFRTDSGETRFDHFAENLLEKITIFSRSKQNYVGQLFSIYFVSLSGSAAAA